LEELETRELHEVGKGGTRVRGNVEGEVKKEAKRQEKSKRVYPKVNQLVGVTGDEGAT